MAARSGKTAIVAGASHEMRVAAAVRLASGGFDVLVVKPQASCANGGIV
jgi:hypothetical protein